MMTPTVDAELQSFRDFFTSDALSSRMDVERVCSDAFILRPKASGFQLDGPKDVGLTLLGLVHGNEVAGIAALNGFLAHLAAQNLTLPFALGIGLGNVEAAKRNQRFIDCDLNRSFLRPSAVLREERRADELEALLSRTRYLLDFHQTREISDRPFFIFPHTPSAFEFAKRVAPTQTVVTHWGRPFSAEGRCSDEFVNAQGGVGITVELGRNGFDPYQIAAGVQIAQWTVRAVSGYLGCQQAWPLDQLLDQGEVYTWAEILPFPEGNAVLDPGWHNFRVVNAGERLGMVDGQPLLAPVGGRILFPKYLDPVEPGAPPPPRPTEICRIMKRVSWNELPRASSPK